MDTDLGDNPAEAHSYLEQAGLLALLKRYEESLAAVDRALELEPDNAYAWSFQGSILLQLKRYGEAMLMFGHAVQIYPNEEHLYLGLGKAWESLRHYSRPEAYDAALELNDRNPLSHRGRSVALKALGGGRGRGS